MFGFGTPRPKLPHPYSVFGALELVKGSTGETIPVRVVNPSTQPVKIFHGTTLADVRRVDSNVATYQLGEVSSVFPLCLQILLNNSRLRVIYSHLPSD